jgi:imidazole glycerol phosphate synthase glutamine amidotransferase subunit
MITFVSFHGGSLTTLEGAMDRIGFGHCRAASPDQAAPDGPIVLAGSGPLDPAYAALKASGWWRELPQLAAAGRPVVGINLGLHLLAEGSEESPKGGGLGLIPGLVRRLGPGLKVPHMGWAPVRQLGGHPLLPETPGGWLYFCHSHALEPASSTLLVAVHGRPFSVMECRGRTVGIQAQVEKSGRFGLALLEKTLAVLGEEPLGSLTPDCN